MNDLYRPLEPPSECRICGCTDDDCSGCIKRTGQPCEWVEFDLCSACIPAAELQELDERVALLEDLREQIGGAR